MERYNNSGNILEFFNNTFGNYDKWIPKVVPYYEEIQKEIVKTINCFYPKTRRLKILELGVGTGRTSQEILTEYTLSSLEGIESSSDMINTAKDKLKIFGDRLNIREADFVNLDFPKDSFDVIVSSLSIHHYDEKTVRDLIQKIYAALKKDGIFVNADIVKFKSVEYSKNAMQIYLNFLKSQLKNNQAVSVWQKHIKLQDKPQPLEYILDWLKDAGFRDVSTTWRYWGFAVYSGRK